MKNLLRLTLLLCLTAVWAVGQPVQIPNSCPEGSAFTIRIPVRPGGYAVQYEWYRNDTLIAGQQNLLLGDEHAIAYTIPADKAFGDNVVFHFKYKLNDGHEAWSSSPKYAITFFQQQTPDCQMVTAGEVEGSEVTPPALSCLMSNAGVIEGSAVAPPQPHSCLMSSAGAISSE